MPFYPDDPSWASLSKTGTWASWNFDLTRTAYFRLWQSFLQGLIPCSFFISFSFSFLPALLVTHCFNCLFPSARLPTPLTCFVIRAPHLLWQGGRKDIPSVTSLDRIHCSNLFHRCVCGDRRSVNCIAWVVCTWNCPPLIPDYGYICLSCSVIQFICLSCSS